MLLPRRKYTSVGILDFLTKRDRYFAERVENLPNSVGVLKLMSFKLIDLEGRHRDLLGILADSYATGL